MRTSTVVAIAGSMVVLSGLFTPADAQDCIRCASFEISTNVWCHTHSEEGDMWTPSTDFEMGMCGESGFEGSCEEAHTDCTKLAPSQVALTRLLTQGDVSGIRNAIQSLPKKVEFDYVARVLRLKDCTGAVFAVLRVRSDIATRLRLQLFT